MIVCICSRRGRLFVCLFRGGMVQGEMVCLLKDGGMVVCVFV